MLTRGLADLLLGSAVQIITTQTAKGDRWSQSGAADTFVSVTHGEGRLAAHFSSTRLLFFLSASETWITPDMSSP